jgi:hypothetical protein
MTGLLIRAILPSRNFETESEICTVSLLYHSLIAVTRSLCAHHHIRRRPCGSLAAGAVAAQIDSLQPYSLREARSKLRRRQPPQRRRRNRDWPGRRRAARWDTMLFTPASMLLLTPLLQKLSVDPDKQLLRVTNVGTGAQMIAIKRELPAHTLPEFLAYAKAIRAS